MAGDDVHGHARTSASADDAGTRLTVWVALAANAVIAVAKAVAGAVAGAPALLSEAAHSGADCLNEGFLLASLARSRRSPDTEHPFGYGKERYFWSLLAAVGIFVVGGCYSFFQGFEALRETAEPDVGAYTAGLAVLGIALLAEGASLLRALAQVRGQAREAGVPVLRQMRTVPDPALRTVLAEDSTAVLGVLLAAAGLGLHMATGNPAWEAAASMSIGLLLVFTAYRLGRAARDQLIGEAVDAGLQRDILRYLSAQPEVDVVTQLLTMRLGLHSTLLAVRIDLTDGLDSAGVEAMSGRLKQGIRERWPHLDHVFLDITRAGAGDRRAARRFRAELDDAVAESAAPD
ncbi:cation diffusion facilitator family transporter [Yinghuangia soli]|uniref:Cation diffusion facilitator family transporter n=1 Tax=Yinghuangia soli TaxID=2908204 RepID=A0AA41U191_9ACTN|nr:cation diffusion facilitator family transporter [Yinghuangia soli]MCF2527282.1 cation diffusion facilitator family transporter [Yinghuangia soli]